MVDEKPELAMHFTIIGLTYTEVVPGSMSQANEDGHWMHKVAGSSDCLSLERRFRKCIVKLSVHLHIANLDSIERRLAIA